MSYRVYAALLFAYPAEFRREYGPQMIQVFRDSYSATNSNGLRKNPLRFWLHTLTDLAVSAAKEHRDSLGKATSIMNNLRRDVPALLGCIGIIVVALFLLSYGRQHQVTSILMFSYALDALVTAGVLGNLIVFVLVKTTKFNPLRVALWTLLATHGALLLVAVLIGNRVDPQFRLGSVLLGYVVSFLFWFALHWVWSKGSEKVTVSS